MAMWTRPGGAGNARGAAVKINAATHKVNRRLLPDVGDLVCSPLYFDGFGRHEPTVTKLLKEGEQPAFACDRSGWIFRD